MSEIELPSSSGRGHRGGAWKVAYADFVTALMALFIVLWLMSAGKETREAISSYFKDPRGYAHLGGSGQAGNGQGIAVDTSNVRDLQHRLQAAMAQLPGFQQFRKFVQFSVTGEGLRVELLESEGGMFFQTGNARPSSYGDRLLGMLAGELGRLPNHIVIEGHTDARPYRSTAPGAYTNWELSVDRANAARRLLLAAGVPPAQIAEIRGYAERQALIASDPHDSRNRRVSVILKFVAPPGVKSSD